MTATGTASPPHLISAVITRLQDASALDGVLVRWGLLSTLPRERERIYLLGTADYRRELYSTGHRVRREAYDLRVLVEVHLVAEEPPSVSERFWDLIDAIDLALQNDSDFGVAQYNGELRMSSDEMQPATDGWIARGLLRLEMARSR